jgi:hypothetical protein
MILIRILQSNVSQNVVVVAAAVNSYRSKELKKFVIKYWQENNQLHLLCRSKLEFDRKWSTDMVSVMISSSFI